MVVILQNTQLKLVVNPAVGGAVVRFDALTEQGNIALMRPGNDTETDPNRLAMYPLVPWSNRIAQSGFEWQGQSYSLDANVEGEPLPIHGDGWQQSWQVASQQEQALRLELYSQRQAPFHYRAEMEYRLMDNCLEVTLSVTHLGGQPTPYGLGLHPWFPRTDDTRVTAKAEGVWEVDKAQLPTQWRKLAPNDAWNFHTPQTLPQGLIDNLFTGWNGHAQLAWPKRGVTLELETEPAIARYLMFSPGAQADFFCFEPVSHEVNAHHFSSPIDHGLVVVGKGEKLTLTCRFIYRGT